MGYIRKHTQKVFIEMEICLKCPLKSHFIILTNSIVINVPRSVDKSNKPPPIKAQCTLGSEAD